MIYADLGGKRSVAEDLFTSNVFGLLFLLPARNLLDFLALARTCRTERIFLRVDPSPKLTINFWPYLNRPRVCIPDDASPVDTVPSSNF
jgi:hypothetical protein